MPQPEPLKEGIDYYIENGLFVFTGRYLLERGYCCQSGCRHCPYGYKKEREDGKGKGADIKIRGNTQS